MNDVERIYQRLSDVESKVDKLLKDKGSLTRIKAIEDYIKKLDSGLNFLLKTLEKILRLIF